MTTADTIAKLERALDRAYMHECPGNPESPEKTNPCRHPALQHMTDRVTAIFTREILIQIQSIEDSGRADDLKLIPALAMLADQVMTHSRVISAIALSCIAAAHDDPDWARRVTETFRRALAAMEFSGEMPKNDVVDHSAAYLRWMRPE